MITTKTYTPEQVADILQLSKNTVYNLIGRGEIIAKKFGKVYRVPAASLSFALTGLDFDFFKAERRDLQNIKTVQKEIKKARKNL